MKRLNYLILIIIFFSFSLESFSQDRSLAIGIGAGLTRGVNEAKRDERTIGPLFGIYGLFNNGLMQNFTPELSFSYYSNATENVGGFSQYSTTYIPIELRLRYYIDVASESFQPYVFGGLGAMIYNVNDVPNNPDPNSSNSGVTLSIPFGIGFTYNFSKSVGLDFNIYPNMSLTDNYNPVYDDIFDASWVTRLGVHFTVVEFEKDSDGDGLSDKREIELGTNPNNPDTDGDGLLDGEEVNKYKTNPLDPDTDGGGVKDGVEVATGANPLDPDDDILSIPVGEKIILKGIEFVTGKADITPKSERILNYALKALQAAPTMELEIVGHTDNVGDREMNIKLSLDRAESVKKWLVDRGITPNRLTTKGVGPDQPLVPNTSDENRQRNRRVEFFRAK